MPVRILFPIKLEMFIVCLTESKFIIVSCGAIKSQIATNNENKVKMPEMVLHFSCQKDYELKMHS